MVNRQVICKFIIGTLFCIGLGCLIYLYIAKKPIDDVTNTVIVQEREVKSIEQNIKQQRTANDIVIQERVQKKVDDIPTDIDDLIALANEIIRNSDKNR